MLRKDGSYARLSLFAGIAFALWTLNVSKALAGAPAGPAPTQTIQGLAFSDATTNGTTGDPHVTVGLEDAILKANDQVEFLARNPDGSLQLPGTTMTDQAFWGTSAMDATGAGNAVAIVNLRGDGRVYYDPYGPDDSNCNPLGRFFITELAQLQVNGQLVGGTLLAISDGENPLPSSNWSIYAIYDSTAACQNLSNCAGDQPRLGFNTNWVTIWTDRESSGGGAQLFVTSKHDAECAGIAARQIFGGRANLMAPAITYKTNGQDLDGSVLYFVNNFSENAGELNVFTLTGSPTNAVFNSTPIYTPATTVNGGWNATLPNIKQKGGTFIIPGNQDDRFTGVVVRNHAIWAAQTIALPANKPSETAVQWWQIAIDTNSPSDGTVTDQERAGTHGTKDNGLDGNATDASIAVNAAGDAVVGYSVVPYDEAAGTWGYLAAGYTFQSHSDCQEAFGPTIYQKGVGLFPVASTLARTGDYTGTAVDPMDDTSFITSAVSAGSQSGSYYYWSQSAALISPIAPPEPTFIASVQTETECVSSQQNCSVTLTAPGKSKDGDMFIIAVSSGLAPGSLTTPTGWINLPFVNQSNVVKLHAADNCGVAYTTWMPTKVFGGTPGSSQIKFTVPEVNGGGCSGNESNEIGAFLLDYRNTCQNVVNQFNGQSNFTAYGYNPVGDSTRITTGQITVPDNTTLLDIFQAAGSESAEDSGLCEDYTPISGTPQLTAEAPRVACDGMQMLAADLYTGATMGANYGGYSTSEQYSGPNIGFHILVPPW